jgi:hypothetical protein
MLQLVQQFHHRAVALAGELTPGPDHAPARQRNRVRHVCLLRRVQRAVGRVDVLLRARDQGRHARADGQGLREWLQRWGANIRAGTLRATSWRPRTRSWAFWLDRARPRASTTASPRRSGRSTRSGGRHVPKGLRCERGSNRTAYRTCILEAVRVMRMH